jgi:hypothetical protein
MPGSAHPPNQVACGATVASYHLCSMRTILTGVAVVLVVATSSAATSLAAAPASETPVGERRDCRSRGEGLSPQRLPPKPGVRIGPVLFWPSIKIPQGPGARGNGSAWPFIQKTPVILAAGTRLILAVAPQAQSVAAFQHRGRFVPAIRFEACAEHVRAFAYAGTVGKYTGFPFAIGLTTRSACVPMEVWVDGRSRPVRRLVPIGRASC